ncbi:hypothetical protein OsccyDRAFT_1485 [Leptolyngbyaceae cyanobacterium JSC-12]|nr:hypothetical protein OsccyDRAFT_1485 [Leptolyngbyaceae cyanobacterium JSC-12]
MNSLNKPRSFSFLFGLMLISICFLSLVSTKAEAQFFSTPQMLNQPCKIILEEGSINNTRYFDGPGDFPSLNNPDRPNTADAFSFISRAVGRCNYILYNEANYGGERKAVYGALQGRVRIGSEGADNGGGWRARSMKAFPMQGGNCTMVLGDGGVSQYFTGPGIYAFLTGWNFVRSTQGPCTFEVFNGSEFNGRSRSFSSGVDGNTRVGWRVRSIRIS